jgi:hypothetical protein
MVVLSSIGLQMAKGLNPSALTRITAAEVLQRLRTKFHSGFPVEDGAPLPAAAFDWAALGRGVRGILRVAPSSGPHMCAPDAAPLASLTSCARLGPMSLEVKERKAAVKRVKEVVAELVRPDEVGGSAEDAPPGAVQESRRNLMSMLKVLKRNGRVGALQLVFNRSCFAQTVENIFTLSFLVKEGTVKLGRGEGGGITAEACKRAEPEHFASKQAETLQFVLRLDVADWEAAKGRMPLEPLIPHRAAIDPNKGEAEGAAADEEAEEEEEAPPVTAVKAKRKAAQPKRKLAVADDDDDDDEDANDDAPVRPAAKARKQR